MTAHGQVRTYFDRNTRGFLRFGHGGATGAIRRAVWAPGVTDRASAFTWVDGRILQQIRAVGRAGEPPEVVDLGCGVGASLSWLAQRHPIGGVGVTISPVQVELARRRIAAAGLDDRVRCEEGDFTRLPQRNATVDVAFAIESFVLAADASAFFAETARVLRPGGCLVVCDDFLGEHADVPDLPREQRRWLDDFRRGWHVGSLLAPARADALAGVAGLQPDLDEDWTPWLELGRPRDRLISKMVSVGRRLPLPPHPWWSNLVGGNALQHALRRGLLRYRFKTWRRRG